MASVTGGEPKELLLLGGRTLLEWNIDEARAAGISEIVVISSPLKPGLTEFCHGLEGVRVLMQAEPLGLAPAVLLAGVGEDVLVLLPDTLLWPPGASPKVSDAIRAGSDIAIPLEEVRLDEVSSYGIVELDSVSRRITRIVEKPTIGEAPSRLAVAGRFGLSARALQGVAALVAEASSEKEIHLPPLLDHLIQQGRSAIGVPLGEGERRLDCGSSEGYRIAGHVFNQFERS